MKHYIDLFYQDVKISFYEQDKEYFMLSEDVGRCLRMANPRKSIIQYMQYHPELVEAGYSVLAQINLKRNQTMRCFTHRGLLRIADLRGDHQLKKWVDDIYSALDAGLLDYEAPDPEEGAENLHNSKKPKPEQNNAKSSDLELYDWLTDFERAQIIIGIAGLSEGAERENLKQAAAELLLGNSFADVYERHLQEYGEFDGTRI